MSTERVPRQVDSHAASTVATPEPREEGPLFLRLLNPVIALWLRTPFLGPMGNALALLTFTGRKTGKRFSIPVGYHRFEGEPEDVVYLVTSAPWWKNLRMPREAPGAAGGSAVAKGGEEGVPVTLHVKGRAVPSRTAVIRNADELYRRYRTLLDRYGVKKAMRLGLRRLDMSRDPTEEELRRALVGHVMIRVTLAAR